MAKRKPNGNRHSLKGVRVKKISCSGRKVENLRVQAAENRKAKAEAEARGK